MKYVLYILRFFYRIRFWLILLPVLAACYMIWKTRDIARYYEVRTTVYTGVVSGYDIEQASVREADWNTKNSTIVNMMDILKSEATLRRVSMRLYARCLMNGDSMKNNTYINADTYRWLMDRTPKYVLDLIVKGDEDKTVENFFDNMKPDNRDHLYGLFMWEASRYFGYKDLEQIRVDRIASSDMLKLSYQNSDPGITYNTVLILVKEFFDQYQTLRFGETNAAIAYFRRELAEAGTKLKAAEDELTSYNVEKRVINYTDETKEVASINKEFEIQYQDVLMNYAKADAAVSQLEGRIDMNINNMRSNSAFMEKLKLISELQTQITNIDAFGQKNEANLEKLATLKKALKAEERSVSELTKTINENKYSKEGIVSDRFVQDWLAQTLELSKAKAQKEVMEKWRRELNEKYTYYAPIGSTIKSKEREIDFTERTYLSLLEGLNSAILRLRQLQMTTNTLKVTDEPSYPISPLPHKRKMMVLLAFVCTAIFVVAYFLFLELVDRTLRDRIRAERITGRKVLGVMPRNSRRYRPFNQQAKEIAMHCLAKALVPYFGREKPVVINILSTEEGDGKHFVAQYLRDYWQKSGLKVGLLSYREEFNCRSESYLLANNLTDYCQAGDAMIVLVVHQPLTEESVPSPLLESANLNLMIARSDRTWTTIDQEVFEKVGEQSGETPLFLVLNQTAWDVTEDFTGLLPPYSRFRRWLYRLSQLGLTARDTKKNESGV